ncbi:MAG: hypothetical protein Tsb0014_21320 [Pleurocapsa sp.]
MTIIVKHKRTGNEYILLGINGTGEKNNLSPRFLSDLFGQENSMSSSFMTVCDTRGNIFLADIEDLIVLEIDGKKPSEILPEITISSVEAEERARSVFDDEFEDNQDDLDRDEPRIGTNFSPKQPHDNDLDEDEDWV